MPNDAATLLALAECREATIEECAKVADSYSKWTLSDERVNPKLRMCNRHRNMNAKWIAEEIRARAQSTEKSR